MAFRKVEKFEGGKWREIHMSKLKVNDIFRMFDFDGKKVTSDDGKCTAWRATTSPVEIPPLGNWKVDTISIFGKDFAKCGMTLED